MRNAPALMGNVKIGLADEAAVESYLVESAFALTRPIALKITDHRPEALFDLVPVKPTRSSTTAAMRCGCK